MPDGRHGMHGYPGEDVNRWRQGPDHMCNQQAPQATARRCKLRPGTAVAHRPPGGTCEAVRVVFGLAHARHRVRTHWADTEAGSDRTDPLLSLRRTMTPTSTWTSSRRSPTCAPAITGSPRCACDHAHMHAAHACDHARLQLRDVRGAPRVPSRLMQPPRGY